MRGGQRLQRLQRQAVERVDVHRSDTGAAQCVDDVARQFETLRPVDRRLHIGVEILNADAGAGDTQKLQAFKKRVVRVGRIDLDRDLGAGNDVEYLFQRFANRCEFRRAQQAGRAAAQMQVGELAPLPDAPADHADFGASVAHIFFNRRVALRVLGVASAEPAQPVAEGDVQI